MVLRQIKAIALLPGAGALAIPAAILWLSSTYRPGWSLGLPLDALPIAAGGLLVLLGLVLWARCTVLFARTGKGTLAPWDPPRRLVVRGVYRHVRNPMITGVLTVILGEALLFGSWPVLAWFALFLAGNHLWMLRVEEPVLVERFGDDYRTYMRHVPRWIPRLRPWQGRAA